MLSYRRELDGLRALAVIAVIIYHANLKVFNVQIFQGGFFGVDVFFVLSGYLITGIIRNQMNNGTFSFLDFYWRRTKRIVPAFIFMLLVTSGLAFLILLPDDLVTYAKSLQSALYFGSNHFFYGEDSYTAAESIYRPLLHTWSLSVEWQFYIVFPLLVWVINKIAPRYLFSMLLAVALLSLQASSFIVKVNPDMAFYLLPARAWELILGGIATFYDRSNLDKTKSGTFGSFVYPALPLIGLFLILYTMIFIGHEVSHPSFITLLPVIGTCLFIMFSYKGELTNDVLSLKPIVGIGLISYSLYLWHQPVFVFFRFMKHDHFRLEQFALLVLISTILAIITYYFVESVFKKKYISNCGKSCLIFSVVVCLSIAYIIPKEQGFPERFGDADAAGRAFKKLSDIKHFKINGVTCQTAEFDKACYVAGKEKNIILVGDSHAGSLGRHIYQLSRDNGWSYRQLSMNGCIGMDTVTRYYRNRKGKTKEAVKCNKRSHLISKYIENPNTSPSTIIFLSRLPLYLTGKRFDNTLGGVESKGATWISSNENKSPSESVKDKLSLWARLGHEIIIIYPIPEVGWHVPNRAQKELSKYILPTQKGSAYKKLEISTPYIVYKERTRSSYDALDSVVGNNVIRVYPSDVFCNSDKCIAKGDKHLYYFDGNHLSTHGAKLLVEEIAKYLL